MGEEAGAVWKGGGGIGNGGRGVALSGIGGGRRLVEYGGEGGAGGK